jgi:hypothetical protein
MREMRIELHPRQRSPQAALRNRNSSFVLDGEAVLLGVDGRSDFVGLHRADTMSRSSSTPSTSW